jgi:1-aminocyclopropane-1-carboxylate deaminase
MNKTSLLTKKIVSVTSEVPHSRVHALKTLSTTPAICKVKRDDELGFGISGSKWRKYISLIPYLLNNNYKETVVIGSAYSNHVLGISQLLIENKIKPTLFLLGDPNCRRQGNLLLTSLLVPESQMHWIPRKDWPRVEEFATTYINNNDEATMLIPEGACMEAALPGALTLAIDILQNEEETQQQFQHIFIDAGTGLSAIATILACAWLKKETILHVLLLADDEDEFLAKLKQFHLSFDAFTEDPLNWADILKITQLHKPTQACAFGSVNASVMKHIKFLAREEGFFTDPIYSAKLFWEAKNIIRSENLTGSILVIHSGGALTLMGFQKELEKLLTY